MSSNVSDGGGGEATGAVVPHRGSADLDDAFYRELAGRLRQVVRRVCSSQPAHRHDDIVQAALVRIMNLTRAGEGNREFSASYLWKTAYCAMIDEIRAIRRRAEVPMESDDGEPRPIAADRPGPEQLSRAAELRRAFSTCLKKMVESRRAAMTLHLQGHSVAETARLLAWDYKKVENLLYRGRQHLRLCLEGMGLEP